ncbi:hypothetical protein J6590_091874 [Homalodisca vitripennis]|nr:hypothetical protein J6590_091874 [Homalodisca vitripennis]
MSVKLGRCLVGRYGIDSRDIVAHNRNVLRYIQFSDECKAGTVSGLVSIPVTQWHTTETSSVINNAVMSVKLGRCLVGSAGIDSRDTVAHNRNRLRYIQ